MPARVRLVHKVLEGRFHVYTSPEVKGLHASADTEADAQRQAMALVDFFAKRWGVAIPVVEFVESPALLQAAE